MRRHLLILPMILAATTVVARAQQWPSFRGDNATGIARSGSPPVKWTISTSTPSAATPSAATNVAWSTPIPGLAHSSPVVWGDRVFLTTAVAADVNAVVAKGEGRSPNTDPTKDRRVQHQWKLYSLDRRSGRILWERTVAEGVPRIGRHEKASHASATPVTNGTVVVAAMGSEGFYCFDMNGKLLWKQDLGVLDVGMVEDPTAQWGAGSSPIILDDLVIVQNDRQKDSFLVAFDVKTGKARWRSPRDELPAWATPAIARGASGAAAGATIVTNSPRYIRGHDARDGRERWRLADNQGLGPAAGDHAGEVKVSTPVVAGDLVIVTSGYPLGGRPIYAIRVADGSLAWKLDRGSPYATTPIVYQDVLYVIQDNGVLSAYDVKTGERAYQRRISETSGGFTASPVAADGRLYFTSEDGIVYVVRAGREFELLASNDMGEVCMATPAIAQDMLLVRTRTRLYALAAR